MPPLASPHMQCSPWLSPDSSSTIALSGDANFSMCLFHHSLTILRSQQFYPKLGHYTSSKLLPCELFCSNVWKLWALRRSPPRPCWCHMRCNLFVIVIGAFLDVGVIYAAAAADLSPVYAPPVLYNWSGLYLGANIG